MKTRLHKHFFPAISIGARFIFLICWGQLLFSQTNPGISYCSSRGISTLHGYIAKISMETINNSSGNNNGYGNFTNLSTKLQKGADYTIELTPGFVNTAGGGIFTEFWSVYIDFNQDGVFEPVEMVAHGDAAIRINKSFRIPSSAINGPTRMRIQMQPSAEQTNPCATYSFGEVEDYTVDLVTSIAENVISDQKYEDVLADKDTSSIQLFPNPAHGNITIRLSNFNNNLIHVNIYNQLGQKIKEENSSVSGTSTLVVNISNLPPGF
ncbi:MAG TPA: GEVED domain-containing protein, partial [Puia sp.]|nr:GEVED domain-containing protein [Puia sp.]